MTLQAVVIGTSAGGVQALSQVLPRLPADFPAPVLVVVHVPPRQSNSLVDLFAAKCRLPVKEAEDKEPLAPGTIYFAPPDYHVLVEASGTIALSSDEHVNHSRPAIDVLFESAADAFGPELVGIVMTGANSDGAQGPYPGRPAHHQGRGGSGAGRPYPRGVRGAPPPHPVASWKPGF